MWPNTSVSNIRVGLNVVMRAKYSHQSPDCNLHGLVEMPVSKSFLDRVHDTFVAVQQSGYRTLQNQTCSPSHSFRLVHLPKTPLPRYQHSRGASGFERNYQLSQASDPTVCLLVDHCAEKRGSRRTNRRAPRGRARTQVRTNRLRRDDSLPKTTQKKKDGL